MNGQKIGLNHQHCFGHWSLTNHWELDGIFISHVNKNLVSQPKIYKALNLFDSSTKSRVAALFFLKRAGHCQQLLQPTLQHSVFLLTSLGS